MIRHEDIGVEYLLKNGYKIEDIKINNSIYELVGIPDITTIDDKDWEVKVIIGNNIKFTYRQFLYFTDDTNILIFKKKNIEYECVEHIKWKQLKYDVRYNVNIEILVTIDEAEILHNIIKSKRITSFIPINKKLRMTSGLDFTYTHFLSLKDDDKISIYRDNKILNTLTWKELKQSKDYEVTITLYTNYYEAEIISDVIERNFVQRHEQTHENDDRLISRMSNKKEFFRKYGLRIIK